MTAPVERSQGQSLDAANAPAPSTPATANPGATEATATGFTPMLPEKHIGVPVKAGTGIQEKFIELAGGPNAKIVVVPTAGGNRAADGSVLAAPREPTLAEEIVEQTEASAGGSNESD